MGKMIEQIAQERGHTIVAKIDAGMKDIDFNSMDVAIDFSTPDAAFENITSCFKNSVLLTLLARAFMLELTQGQTKSNYFSELRQEQNILKQTVLNHFAYEVKHGSMN